jgi:hypothetical protein
MKKRKLVLAISLALIGACIVMLALARYWPFVLVSLIQHGAQGKIHCWVRVVDQDEKGVAGYRCRIIEERASLLPFMSSHDTSRLYDTDSDGLFEYSSKGAVGRIFLGYDWGLQWKLNPRHLMETRFIGVYATDLARAVAETPHDYLGSRKNPYIIHVCTVCTSQDVRYWKSVYVRGVLTEAQVTRSEYDRAIEQLMKKGEVLSASGQLECYGIAPPWKLLYWKRQVKLHDPENYACVDILAGRVWESINPEGDIAMKDQPLTTETIKQQCFHTFIAGEGCAMLPVLDPWGLVPPKDGYVKEICSSRDWHEPTWTSGRNAVYFYITDGNTAVKMYGRLELSVSGRVSDGLLECYVNFQGERNLFYDGYVRSCDSLPGDIKDHVPPPVQ